MYTLYVVCIYCALGHATNQQYNKVGTWKLRPGTWCAMQQLRQGACPRSKELGGISRQLWPGTWCAMQQLRQGAWPRYKELGGISRQLWPGTHAVGPARSETRNLVFSAIIENRNLGALQSLRPGSRCVLQYIRTRIWFYLKEVKPGSLVGSAISKIRNPHSWKEQNKDLGFGMNDSQDFGGFSSNWE